MKPTLKRNNSKKHPFLPLTIVLVFAIFFLLFTSCQDEVAEIIGPNEQETIGVNSNLAKLIEYTTQLDGSVDNIIDNANCLIVELPVTVSVNGVEIIIDSEEDYEVIEAIFDEFGTDEDTLEIIFPVTIILSDYSEIVINNQDELEVFIEECLGENEEDEDIECIDFQYPISISIYDTNFEVIETVIVENDEALYDFIENLDGSVLASLNFPVTMILSDDSTIEVNNNQELEEAIEAAENECDEDDDNDWDDDDEDECTEEFVELALKECIWNIVSYNGDDVFVNYDVAFDPNYGFTVSENGNVIHDGTWSVSEGEEDDVLVNFETSFQDLSGSWTVVECQIDRFALVQETASGVIEMVMERDCETDENPFECFTSFNATLAKCDDNGDTFALFNLTEAFSNCIQPSEHMVSYHETLQDAESGMNALSEPTAYTNTIATYQTIYVRVVLASNADTYEVFEIELIVEDCSSACTELEVDDYLQTCIWNVVNFNDSDDLIIFDLDFNDDGSVTITGDGQTVEATWSTSQTTDGVWVELDGVNGANIQAISGNWLVVECDPDRLEMTKNEDTMVMEQNCI